MTTIILGIFVGLGIALMLRPKPQPPTIIYMQPEPMAEESSNLGCLPLFAVAAILIALLLSFPAK